MRNTFRFTCLGHSNITATHRSTCEITKEDRLTQKGDCIVGVSARFDAEELERFAHDSGGMVITLRCGALKEVIHAKANPHFKAGNEIVVRRSPFASERTIATHADRACMDFSREFVEMIKNPNATIMVELERAHEETAGKK